MPGSLFAPESEASLAPSARMGAPLIVTQAEWQPLPAPVVKDRKTLKRTRWLVLCLWLLLLVVACVFDWAGLFATQSLIWVFFIFTQSRQNRHREYLGKGDFLESPEDPGFCLVDLEIRQEGLLTGRDRGAAWISERRLYFAGALTSFCVGNADLALGPDSTQPERDFGLRHAHRSIRMSLHVVDREGKEFPSMVQLRQGMRHLLSTKDLASSTQYPPLSLGPDVQAPRWFEQSVSPNGLYIGTAAAPILMVSALLGFRGTWWIWLLAFGAMLASWAIACFEFIRNYHKARQTLTNIEREEAAKRTATVLR